MPLKIWVEKGSLKTGPVLLSQLGVMWDLVTERQVLPAEPSSDGSVGRKEGQPLCEATCSLLGIFPPEGGRLMPLPLVFATWPRPCPHTQDGRVQRPSQVLRLSCPYGTCFRGPSARTSSTVQPLPPAQTQLGGLRRTVSSILLLAFYSRN